MRSFLPLAAIAIAGIAATAAAAQDAPASNFTITGGATLTSDYRFRGLSQTDKRVAVQGTFTISHASGFYVSTWASSVDDYVANGSDAEVDLIAGYSKTVQGTKLDGGILYYYYPGSGGINSDFFEPYANVSHTFGPVGLKVGGNFSWKQHGLSSIHARDGGTYLYGEASLGVPNTGLTLTGHVGHSFIRDYITFGQHYTDWSATAAYAFKSLILSVGYVDTDKTFQSYPAGGGLNRKVGSAGVVASVGVAF